MKSAHRKKGLERFYLERFIDASGLAAEIVEERERPDFVVRVDGRDVGVEVTQLFVTQSANGPLPQAQEAISNRIVHRAREIYEACGAPPAHVSILFAVHELRQIDRDAVAAELASLVTGMNLTEWKRMDWRPERPGPLLDVISLVHGLGVPSREMAHWTVARAGWVAPLTADALQLRVNEKAKLLQEYRTHARENWLVIVSDGMKPSQLFDVRSGFSPETVSSPFDRTYFYGHPDRALVELGPRRADAQ